MYFLLKYSIHLYVFIIIPHRFVYSNIEFRENKT
jgi:hypothetical protein